MDGAGLLAATANVIMQLARPEVGYGVVESRVEYAQLMRHPVRRWLTTVTYLSVALLGTPAERAAYRRLVNRSHAQVRSTPGSPVSYRAFDPELQLWVAACLYQGMTDVYAMLHGPADDQTADAIYREAARLGTTLQMPAGLWPPDRAAFGEYWHTALASVRIDPQVHEYLQQLIMMRYLPRPVSVALTPFSRLVTAGFLPPPLREQMGLRWTERDQQRFRALMRAVATVNRRLPDPVRQLPFNACLYGLRVRLRRDARAPCPGRVTAGPGARPR